MTDSNDDDPRGRKSGRSDRPRTGGERPARPGREARGGGDRPPFRKPRDGDGPRKPREGGDRPFRARDGDGPRKPREGGDRPFRARDGDGPRKPREGGQRPFRARDGDERRPPREGGERPFRARSDERPRPQGDRPFRKPAGERPSRGPDESDRAPWAPRPAGARPAGARPAGARPAGRSEERPRRPERASQRPAPNPEPAIVVPEEPTEERIAKVMARAGVASRRDAEVMIAEGRVTLNGEVLTSPAQNVTPADKITVDGEPLPARERTRLWIFHKPRGLVTTARDPEGRATVFENLPEDMPRVVAIGRLDINTEGLLLLTNDGGLAKVIAHPDTGWLRRYKVRAHGEVTQADLDKLRGGVTVDEMEYGPVEARLDRLQGDNVWITLGLREGKNREVKRILEHLGLQVNRLIRVSFGPFQLGELETGMVEEVRTKVLKEQLGDSLAAQAGVDFESAVREPIAPFGSSAKPRQEPARAERGPRPDRPERGERPSRGPRPERDFGERPRRGRDEEAPRPARASRQEPRRAVWRAEEEAGGEERRSKPRRGADPKAARAEAAARPRERVGTVETEGRRVRVERLVREPAAEEEAPRRRRVERSAPAGDDRPRRPDPKRFGEGPPRGRGGSDREGFAARPPRRDDRRASDGEERPRRAPSRGGDEGPRRGPPRGEASRGAPRGDGPPRRGPPRNDDDRPRRGPPRGEGEPRGAPRGDGPPRRGPPRGDGPPRSGPKGGGFRGGGGGRPGGSGGGGAKGGPRRGRP